MVLRRRAVVLLCGGVACKDSSFEAFDGVIEHVPGVEYGNFDPDHVVRVELEMDEADWAALRFETQNFVTAFSGDCMDGPIGMDYTEFQASISMDDQELSPIRIRKKGLIGSQNTKKPSFSINLDEYVDGAELFGTDNLVLNNATQDPSLIRQCLAYWSFEQAGLPAPRCNFARVSMNDEDLGIYVHVEPVRKSFLRDHFGNDEGDLYEGTVSDFYGAYVQTFDPDSDETDEDMAGIVALAELLEGDAEPEVVLAQLFRFTPLQTSFGVNMLALDGSLGAALTTASTGYNVVYNIEIVLLFMSLAVLGPLAGKRFAGGRDGLRQFGLADLPG